MKSEKKGKLGTLVLALFVLLGVVGLSSTTAQAQWGRDRDRDWGRDRDDRYRRNDRNGRYGGYNDIYQMAQRSGFQDGVYTGSNDAQRRQSYNPQRSHYYRDASDGYNSSYGNRGGYKQAYRDGFLRGYEEGYRRYGGYNRGRNNGSWGRWFPR